MLTATGHNAWGTRVTSSTGSTACLIIMSNYWSDKMMCCICFCTNTICIRFVTWLTDSGSMIDTTESKSAGENRLKDLRPSKIEPSACMPNK